MKFQIILILLCVWVVSPVSLKSQTKVNNQNIRESKKYQDLGIDISKVSHLKIFNPKNVFHFEEILIIDIALLTSENSYYFPTKLNNVNIIIKDNFGNRIPIQPIFVSDEFTKFELYRNTLLKKSTHLLVGCDNGTLAKLKKDFDSLDEDDVRDIFHKNLFWSFPSGCIDIVKSSEIEIYAEFTNTLVFSTDDKNEFQTAIGKIKSNSLKVSIRK